MDPKQTASVHGIIAVVNPLHSKYGTCQVDHDPVDDDGLVCFSGRTIVDGTDCIIQRGREPQPIKGGHSHLPESEWLTWASITLVGHVVTLPDGTTDTITAVRGAGADFDLAGQVLWTLYADTHGPEHYSADCGDMTPTRYTDGVSGTGTGDLVTCFNELGRAGAGLSLIHI